MINTSLNQSAQIHNAAQTTPADENFTGKMSTPKLMLHLEGFVLLAAAIFFYHSQDYAWSTFWLLLLVPDLSFVPYMMNRNVGTFFYNALHTVSLPLVLAALATLFGWAFGIQIALIWLAHIGMDRAIGYGLKYTDSFKNTHLGKV